MNPTFPIRTAFTLLDALLDAKLRIETPLVVVAPGGERWLVQGVATMVDETEKVVEFQVVVGPEAGT